MPAACPPWTIFFAGRRRRRGLLITPAADLPFKTIGSRSPACPINNAGELRDWQFPGRRRPTLDHWAHRRSGSPAVWLTGGLAHRRCAHPGPLGSPALCPPWTIGRSGAVPTGLTGGLAHRRCAHPGPLHCTGVVPTLDHYTAPALCPSPSCKYTAPHPHLWALPTPQQTHPGPFQHQEEGDKS